ncbi:MAG: alpha/beta hydrolase, partial [Cyclobacteriaceae bacterium]
PRIKPILGLPWQVKGLRSFFKNLGPIFPDLSARLVLHLFTTPKRPGKTRPLPELFHTASTFDLPFQKGKLRVYAWGIFGPRVLLVHGWESNATSFRHLIPQLLSKGYRVVAFDGPAHGKSSGRQTTFPQFSQAVETVLDYFAYSGGVSHLIGHSFGAYTSSFMLTEAKGQFPLKKVIAISMPTKVSMATDNLFRFLHVPSKVQRLFHQKLEALAGRKMEEYHMNERFELINAKEVLVVHDVQDQVIPLPKRFNEPVQSEKVKCLITDGFGHYRTIKAPPVMERIVRFLGS